MLRFTLIDEDTHRFAAEWWCFLGSIDNRIDLSGGAELAGLIKQYTLTLDDESFFGLM